jgi:hypothetical protein
MHDLRCRRLLQLLAERGAVRLYGLFAMGDSWPDLHQCLLGQNMLEKIANCFLIGACAVFMVAMGGYARRQFATPRPLATPQPDFKIGESARIDGASAGHTTLVLGISPTCSFCKHDIPIYQRLALTKKVAQGAVQVVAILPPESVDQARAFINQNHIPGAVKVVPEPKDYPFAGTPTILLLDENRVVVWAWKGSLSPEAEKDLFGRLG